MTSDEIKDALIHLSVYAGIPAGVAAFRIASEVIKARESAESVKE